VVEVNQQLKDFFKWDSHWERGFLYGLIGALVYLTFKAQPDANLITVWQQGVTPYGVLWTWMNPFYWTNFLYTAILNAEVGAVFLGYWLLVKKRKMNKVIVELCLYTIVFMEAMHMHQNVTTIMLIPLLTLTPLFLIPMLLERLPFGWSWGITDNIHWWCAFGGNGNGYDNMINPCLTVATKLDFWHVYSLAYTITVIWTIVALRYWWRNHWRGKWEGVGQHFTEKESSAWMAFIEMKLDGWFCSICGEWKKAPQLERGNLLEDGWVEFGISMANGFWFEGEWICWTCVETSEAPVNIE
jgi:hypothetical protein